MWAWIQNELGTGNASRAVALLADVGLKGIVLMAFAGLCALLMRRSPASARHLVWMLALVGLLFLPVISLLVPTWQVPILPAVETPALVQDGDYPAIADSEIPSATEYTGPVATPVIETPRQPVGELIPTSVTSPPSPVQPTQGPPPAPTPTPIKLTTWLLATWLTVAVALLLPLLTGLVLLRRMGRRATPFPTEALPRLTQELAEALEVRHLVSLLRAPHDTMPMAAGFFRPVVFLPADAESWSDEKCRAVLLHELAHVKRRDCLTHAVAHLAVSLYWFNPLAWLALRQLRIEREHACDDLVLVAGEGPTEYAEILLDVARSLRARPLTATAAITMAKKSHLEGRLLAVLDAARNRKEVTRGIFSLLAVLAVGLVLLLSPIELARSIDNDVPEYAIGNWHTQGANVYVGESNLHMPLELEITAEGAIRGRLGDAPLIEPRISTLSIPERWNYRGRHFDYKIEASLKGRLNDIDYDGPLFLGLVDMNGRWGVRPLLSFRALGQDRDGLTQLSHYVMEPHINPYLQLFSHDIRASVVAVRDPSAETGPILWEADGVPLRELPAGFEGTQGSVTAQHGYVRREFFVLANNFAPTGITTDYAILCTIPGAGGMATGTTYDEGVKRIAISTELPEEQREATLRVGVASGAWSTLVSGNFGSGSGQNINGEERSVLFSDVVEKDGSEVVVTHSNMSQNFRVVAFDKNNALHPLSNISSKSVGNSTQSEFSLNSLSSTEVDHLEFQVRDYVWREIPNIALHPSEAADESFPSATLTLYNGAQGSSDKYGVPFGPSDGKVVFGKSTAVSEFEWTYVGRVDEGWQFHFKRRFPADQPSGATNVARTLTYTGDTMAIFEDSFQWIGVEESIPEDTVSQEFPPSTRNHPGWLKLEFRAQELLARSADERSALVRNNSRLLRVESDETGVERIEDEELLRITISDGPSRPARYGHVAAPNLGTRRELERTNKFTSGPDQLAKEYILQRNWDGAYVGIPALVMPSRLMHSSEVWRTWRSANDSRAIEYTDNYGWRFVAHGDGWSPRRPDEIRYPLLSLFDSYRPDGTLYNRTELTEGRPDTTRFFDTDGTTLVGQTRLAWNEQDGTASLADYTWRTENGHYRRYVGTPGGVIRDEEVLALAEGEFLVQERLHHTSNSEALSLELDVDAIIAPLVDFRHEARESNLAAGANAEFVTDEVTTVQSDEPQATPTTMETPDSAVGTYHLKFRANEVLAQSADQRVTLIRNGSSSLRLEANSPKLDGPDGEDLGVAASGSAEDPVRLGMVLSGGSLDLERLDYLHRLGAERGGLVASYILQRGWDGALVTIPAAVTVPSAMMRSDAWKEWAERKNVQQIEFIDELGRRYVVNALGWSRSGLKSFPVIPRMERFRPDDTLECYTVFEQEHPTLTVFYDVDGETITQRVRIRWSGMEGAPYVQEFTWRAPDGTYRNYHGTTGGVIKYESSGGLKGSEYDLETWVHRAPDADEESLTLNAYKAIGAMDDFTRSVPATTAPAPFALHWVSEGGVAFLTPWHEDSTSPEKSPGLWLDYETLLDDGAITSVEVVPEEDGTHASLRIQFTADGGDKLHELTTGGVARKLAVLVEGEVLLAPVVQAPISNGEIRVVGEFSVEAARRLAETLQPVVR